VVPAPLAQRPLAILPVLVLCTQHLCGIVIDSAISPFEISSIAEE
jgi:hypothetical protein